MFPSCFYFNLFLLQKKHIFSFNIFQKQSFIDIFSEAAACSLKNIEMFLEAATHTRNISCTFFFQKQLFIDIFQKQPQVF